MLLGEWLRLRAEDEQASGDILLLLPIPRCVLKSCDVGLRQ